MRLNSWNDKSCCKTSRICAEISRNPLHRGTVAAQPRHPHLFLPISLPSLWIWFWIGLGCVAVTVSSGRIPADIERRETSTVRLIVEHNLIQIKRQRTAAMMKMGLAAFLVIVEYIIARYTGLDMGRFLNWHSANIMAYNEIIGETQTVPAGRSHTHSGRIHTYSGIDRGGPPVRNVLYREPHDVVPADRPAGIHDCDQHVSVRWHGTRTESVRNRRVTLCLQHDRCESLGYRRRTGSQTGGGSGRTPPTTGGGGPSQSDGVRLCRLYPKLRTVASVATGVFRFDHRAFHGDGRRGGDRLQLSYPQVRIYVDVL